MDAWIFSSVGLLCRLFAFIVSILAILIGGFCIKILRLHRKYAHIPSPRRESFILGHFPAIRRLKEDGTFLSALLLQYAQECGPTYVLFFLHKPLLFTMDQQAVKELLITGGYPKSRAAYIDVGFLYGERFIGRGLVTETDHDVWARRRAFMNPAFHRQFLKTLMDDFNDTADDLMKKLSSVADGKSIVSLYNNLHCVTLDVIGKVAFGMDISSLNDPTSPFPRATFKAFQGFSTMTKSLISKHIPFIDRSFKHEVRQACRFLRDVGRKCLDERKLAIQRGDHVPTDILTYILDAKEKGVSESIEEALDDFVTFFVAGQETTANALSFVILELGRNPDILTRLKDEVDTIVGKRSNITLDDVNAMEYGSRVFKESLRLYPPASLTFREVMTDQVIGGYRIPAETSVAMSTYASGRHHEFHEDPLTFDPDRFLPDSDRRPTPYSYFPFSLGPRSCIGITFAQIEAKLILAKFIQRFDFELDPNQSFDIEENTTLKPKGGTAAKLTLRD